MLSITIDWLSVNFKEMSHAANDFVRTYASFPPVVSSQPRFGYSVAEVDAYGAVVQWNPDRSDMGYHVIFAGSALRNIFENTPIQPDTLLRATVDSGGSISRLDLAKDLTGEAVDMQAIYKSLEQGDYRGTARTFGRITSNNDGDTIYIGSRQSERFIRLYDKAAQQGMVGERWYRFELETKGMVARALAVALAHQNLWGVVFDNVVRNMAWMERVASWNNFFGKRDVSIGLPKIERQTDRERWIEGQVIPAVAKHYIDNPTSEAVSRLIETLNLIDRQRKE